MHIKALHALFKKLSNHNLTVNLVKSEFTKATVQYIGHILGQGQFLPTSPKIRAILNLPLPDNKKALSKLIGILQKILSNLEHHYFSIDKALKP